MYIMSRIYLLFLPIPIDPSTPDFFELYLNNNNNNNNGGNTGTTDANNFGSLGNNRKHKNVKYKFTL